jgi:hypothetical protein
MEPSRDFEGCSANSLKGVSSRILRQKRPDLAARYLERRALVAVFYQHSEGLYPTTENTTLENGLISPP